MERNIFIDTLYDQIQGPVLPKPLIDPLDLARLVEPNVEKDLKYVGDAITLTRHKLEGKVPLIGFTGAPVSKLISTTFVNKQIIKQHDDTEVNVFEKRSLSNRPII